MTKGIQAVISQGGSASKKFDLLVSFVENLERTVFEQKGQLDKQQARISRLESIVLDGSHSDPVEEEADEAVPAPNSQLCAWVTPFQSPPSADNIEFELVIVPFTYTFKHLWTSEYEHNVRTGPNNLWTSVAEGATWLDPLIPTEKSDIDILAKHGLIQRVRVSKTECDTEGKLIEAFVEKFGASLENVTNLYPSCSLGEAVHRRFEGTDETPGELPEWTWGIKASIVPLKPTILNDKVLEYLPIDTLRPAVKWDLSFFTKPSMSQNVHDSKTGTQIHRLFFTTVEGYLGFTANDFGLGTWGMSYKS